VGGIQETDVESEVVGEAEALVLRAGGAVADEDGAADDGGLAATAREDLRRLHHAVARRLGQSDRPQVLRAAAEPKAVVGFAPAVERRGRIRGGAKGEGARCGFGVRSGAVKSNRSGGEGFVFVWRSGAPGPSRTSLTVTAAVQFGRTWWLYAARQRMDPSQSGAYSRTFHLMLGPLTY
jgi:hypothetical protein